MLHLINLLSSTKTQITSVITKKICCRLAVAMVATLCLTFSSCKKSEVEPVDPPVPAQPKPGAVKGSIVPADAASKVLLVTSGGGSTTELVNPGGNFKVENVPAGNYSVTVIPKLGYTAPPSTNVIVTAGDTANAGTFNLLPDGRSKGYFRFTMDATAYDISAPDVSSTYASNVLTINATTTPTIPYWTFKINLANITGPASVNITPFTAGSYIEANRYLATTVVPYSTTIVSTDPLSPGGSASVSISELNSGSRVVLGTFTATLPQKGIGGTAKRLTNGSFQLNY